jgi:hypothetical protein
MNEPMEPHQSPTAARATCDPRDVPALVLRRISVVKSKESDLAVAIARLLDITQQLARTHGAQSLVAEQLRCRVQALEAAAAVPAASGPGEAMRRP